MAATNNYTFDANKLGVLTGAVWSGGLTNRWQGTSLNTLGQITQESWNGSGLTLRASGLAGSATAVSAALDGGNVGNLVYGSGRWYADLGLNTGTHTLAATATYPVPLLTNKATSAFTVVGTNSVTDYYDGAGNVTSRVFANGKTQTLTWDGLGRLVSVTQRDSSTNGFNWTALYDGLGRRLRTIHTPVGTNVVYAAQTLVTDSFYDPQVESLEVAVSLNGQRTWKVMGPDINGGYGSMQGVGGLEATVRELDGLTTPVINDYFGNVLATVSGTNANWNPVRVGGYGPVNGYQAPVLSPSVPLAETLVWRSRRIDPSGFYCLGARYYDPLASHFISTDPLGHSASMDLYSFCAGDAVNRFDPTGRFGKSANQDSGQFHFQAWPNEWSFSEYLVRKEWPHNVERILATGYPEPPGGSIADTVLRGSHEFGYPASTTPGGSPNIYGEPLWINANQVEAAGGVIVRNPQIVAEMRESGEPPSLIDLYQRRQVANAEGEVVVQGRIPSSAINTGSMMVTTRGAQGLSVLGALSTGINIGNSINRSIDAGTPAPFVAQTVREGGGWAGAWAGFTAVGTVWFAAGIEMGPGAIVTGLVGGAVGGYWGYRGADVIANEIENPALPISTLPPGLPPNTPWMPLF